MRAWTSFQPDVQGVRQSLTTPALALLLQTGNPALGTVGGRASSSAGVAAAAAACLAQDLASCRTDVYGCTSSRKILELLADALLEAKEAEEAAAGGRGRGEDEWESDDDGDGDDDDDDYGVGGVVNSGAAEEVCSGTIF